MKPVTDRKVLTDFLTAHGAKMKCEVCAANDWTVTHPGKGLLVSMPIVDAQGEVDLSRTMPAFVVVCRNCGNMRFHAVAIVAPELITKAESA